MGNKRQTTFAKMDRERALRERRERKKEKKDAAAAARKACKLRLRYRSARATHAHTLHVTESCHGHSAIGDPAERYRRPCPDPANRVRRGTQRCRTWSRLQFSRFATASSERRFATEDAPGRNRTSARGLGRRWC